MKTNDDIYREVFGDTALDYDSERAECMEMIEMARSLDGGGKDTLIAAFKHGPLDAGDVPSKAGRGGLVEDGLMARVVVNGSYGYSACTYKGAWVYKCLMAMRE